jgi:hypothetical protein
MEIGQIISEEKIGERQFDPKELKSAVTRIAFIEVMSWGATNWGIYKDLVLKFDVNGHHHKGSVYIALGWNDTFVVYFADNSGKIVDKKVDVYIDQLIQIIDKRVEWIEGYK